MTATLRSLGSTFSCAIPLDDGYGDEERILERVHRAEQAARCVERARRFHTDRPVVSVYFPELPDDHNRDDDDHNHDGGAHLSTPRALPIQHRSTIPELGK
ncbi:hypothetical protein [Nocardia sp. NPDC059228]|uniref:hypothetical protein n=1 Tax=Nocardia sp. NPDC059228 TaxID=3346777 RepID=UPI0036849824